MAFPRSRRSRAASALLVGVLAVGLSACTAADNGLAEQYRAGSDQGYIAANFQVEEIPVAERGAPVTFAGVTERGDKYSSDDTAGDVAVVNFWFAGCAPCRVEAPLLEEVWQEYQGEGVAFVGVNTYDQAEQALSFAKEHGVTYPSFISINDGTVKLAFAAYAPLQSTPITLILDKEGRVAARMIGQIKSASILSTLVRDLLAESS